MFWQNKLAKLCKSEEEEERFRYEEVSVLLSNALLDAHMDVAQHGREQK